MTAPVPVALLPCPVSWCDDPRPELCQRGSHLFFVRCAECQTQTPYSCTEDEAAEAWNTRAPSASTEKLREALEAIANPLAALQRDAEAQGCRLSGLAYSIANDPEHLKRLARAALSEVSAS